MVVIIIRRSAPKLNNLLLHRPVSRFSRSHSPQAQINSSSHINLPESTKYILTWIWLRIGGLSRTGPLCAEEVLWRRRARTIVRGSCCRSLLIYRWVSRTGLGPLSTSAFVRRSDPGGGPLFVEHIVKADLATSGLIDVYIVAFLREIYRPGLRYLLHILTGVNNISWWRSLHHIKYLYKWGGFIYGTAQ
jgi:hypothetical protein